MYIYASHPFYSFSLALFDASHPIFTVAVWKKDVPFFIE